ncbi:hypothetical protein J6590_080204 [Homalodisca vitripennis]|nr:hypothetical protein J6590_080204 [Homalodisca vitripennis]
MDESQTISTEGTTSVSFCRLLVSKVVSRDVTVVAFRSLAKPGLARTLVSLSINYHLILMRSFDIFHIVNVASDTAISHLKRSGVDGVTNVCGTCKPGAGLLNTIPDAAPPPDNCFVLISGNNDVAAGRQNIIFNNLEEIIKNCRTSKVLITPLFPRHDLPPDSPIQETIRVANAYISELCVRSEGVEMLDISRIGRQLFTSHGQHLRESGKRLLTCLMIAHLATMAPDPRRHKPPLEDRNPIFRRRQSSQGCCFLNHSLTPLRAQDTSSMAIY